VESGTFRVLVAGKAWPLARPLPRRAVRRRARGGAGASVGTCGSRGATAVRGAVRIAVVPFSRLVGWEERQQAYLLH